MTSEGDMLPQAVLQASTRAHTREGQRVQDQRERKATHATHDTGNTQARQNTHRVEVKGESDK
eukprot:1420920-Amphidinium_carterae.6